MHYASTPRIPIWGIDELTLSQYYKSESTQFGTYFSLKKPAARFPSGFYDSERDLEISLYEERGQKGKSLQNEGWSLIAENSAGEVHPSEKMALDFAAAQQLVVMSGNEARARRGIRRNTF